MIKEDQNAMMRWQVQFIEVNKYAWEKRRDTQKKKVYEEEEKWEKLTKDEKIKKLLTKDTREMRKSRADQKQKLWKDRRDRLVVDLEDQENDLEGLGGVKEEDDRLRKLKSMSLEVKLKRQAWKMEKDLTISRGGPQWPFLLKKRPLLLIYWKGTHH